MDEAIPRALEGSEAFDLLSDAASDHTIPVSADALAALALRITADADFAVASDALAALLRRAASARRDDLRILTRPNGRGCGWYRVGRDARHAYDLWLTSIDPPAGSCSCPDYGKA